MRESGQRASAEAKRYRLELRRTQATLDRQSTVLAELQRLVIRGWLEGRLADPRDFDVHVGVATVLDADGRIDFRALALSVRDLVYRSPHLAAPGFKPDELAAGRVESASTGTRSEPEAARP